MAAGGYYLKIDSVGPEGQDAKNKDDIAVLKVDGVYGPTTYDGTVGWFGVLSFELRPDGAQSHGSDRSIHADSGSLLITMPSGRVSRDFRGDFVARSDKNPIRGVTLAFRGSSPEQELVRITLNDVTLAETRWGIANPPIDLYRLGFAKSTYTKGSPAHAGLMVRRQDWGSIQAAKVLSPAKGEGNVRQ